MAATRAATFTHMTRQTNTKKREMPEKSKRKIPRDRRDKLVATFNGGRFAEAEAHALLLADWYPDSGFVWKVLGAARQEQGKEAVSALRKAAVLSPNDAEAHNNLGNELTRLGRIDEALVSLRRAVALDPLLAEAHNNLGNALIPAGCVTEALKSYRNALDVKSNYPEAHNNLGVAHKNLGQLVEAEVSYVRALQLRPNYPDAQKNLDELLQRPDRDGHGADLIRHATSEVNQSGVLISDEHSPPLRQGLRDVVTSKTPDIKMLAVAVKKNLTGDLPSADRDALLNTFTAGKFVEVEARSRYLAAQYPDSGFIWKMWGTALLELQNIDGLPKLEMAAQLSPNDPDIYNNLGNAFIDAKRTKEAIAALRHALFLSPSFFLAHNNLGNALAQAGRYAEAAESYRDALRLAPDYAEAHHNLGLMQKELVGFDEAASSFRRALELNPDYAEVYNSLGAIQRDCGRIDEAADSYRRALEINPGFARAYNNLGNVLKNLGQLDEAAACYRQALSIQPEFEEAYSNLLYLHAFTRNITPEAERALAAEWEKIALSEGDRAAAKDAGRLFLDSPSRSSRAGRKLKIGIMSAEIGQHAVTEFLLPFLEQVDRSRFHVTLFPTTVRREPRVEELKALANEFRSLVGLSDSAAADLIRAEQIDILIDTTSHLTGCRLGIVAHRAAPVQCHYIGYHGSTGLTEMDWFIGDNALLPEALDGHFSERIWRLPRLWIAYKGDTSLPESQWRPQLDGSIVFGSFNNLAKVREEALALWAKVLHAVPNSTLLLKDRSSISTGVQERVRRLLSVHGIESARVVFAGHTADWKAHMALYDSIDIALDPVPLNSGTTAFDALWMGVPLVSIEGTWMGARMTSAMLKSLGKSEWVAQSENDYVAIVSSLAGDVEGRTKQRAEQRKMMAASPLCDAVGLTRALEDAFEKMFDIRWPISTAHETTDGENRKIGRG